MDNACACIESAMEELDRQSEFGSRTMRNELRSGLKFLKTFVMCITSWSNVDEDVHQPLNDVLIGIEAALGEAGLDLADAEEGGDESLINLYADLLGKIELLKPKISEVYDYLSGYSFRPRSPVTGIESWNNIFGVLCSNLRGLISPSANLVGPLKRQIEALIENLGSLRSYLLYLSSFLAGLTTWTDFCSHLVFVAICAARLYYSCWADKIDESKIQDLIILVSDLQQKIKPCNPGAVEVYLGLLKAIKLYKPYSDQYTVPNFLKYLLPVKNLGESLHEGLAFLILFLINTQEEYGNDVELISVDIKTVIAKVGCINSSFHGRQREAGGEVFQLLVKIELLKAEVVLMQLINSSTKDKGSAKNPSEILVKGARSLQSLLKRPPRGITKKGKLILTHFEEVARGAGSLYDTFHARQTTEDMIRDALKLLVNVKLLKAEVFLIELINGNADLDCHIESLHEGLEFLRKFVSGPPNENSENGKVMLTHVEDVANQAISLYYSFSANQSTENFFKEMNHLLPNLLEKINLVKKDVKNIYLQVRSSMQFNFPKTDGLGFIDFFLENLRNWQNYKSDSAHSLKHQIEVVLADLDSLKSFLSDTAELCNEHRELENIRTTIIGLAYEADYVIDSIVLRNGAVWYHLILLSDIIEELKLIKTQVKVINEEKKYAIRVPNVSLTSSHLNLILQPITPSSEEVMVELKDQANIIIDHLIGGSLQREIVSIVGMAGIGKTTLAKNVYDNPVVEKQFHIRAWCSVSQAHQKREMLLKILGDISEHATEVQDNCEEDLEELLFRRLKGNSYLIVMDDIWHIKAWNDLERAFPDDGNRSRILFTSREREVALGAKSSTHSLRLLHDDESWRLLQEMLFHKEDCPEELLEVGRLIAESCNGLPLAIVAIAGLLYGTDKKQESWRKIAENLSSNIINDPESRCRAILELSYNHLPDFLKPCFLYFGAFLEEKEVLTKKLKWLWIAEGFIRRTEQKNFEEVAEDCLMDLISRSLIMAAERRSDGGVKSCRIHDMLHNLCLSKAGEENFFQPVTWYGKHFNASSNLLDFGVDSNFHFSSDPIKHFEHRISVGSKRNHFIMLKPSGPRVRSLLVFATTDRNPSCPYDASFIPLNFKLLRVLDLESINMGNSFPSGIELLFQLRYLAVTGLIDSIPSSIAQLGNLETFLVKGLKGKVELPDAIWNMERLRHLHVNNATFQLQDKKLENSPQLHNLVTLSSPSLLHGEDTMNILKRLPGLLKLRCIFSESRDDHGKCNPFPALNILCKLESLKILYNGGVRESCEFNLPLNLKKLTLSGFHLPWDCISAIGKLPNLEVLKLLFGAFDGKTWEMAGEEFGKLKFLKLDSLDLVEWKAWEDNLANLEHLILRRCKKLVEIPSGLGEINKLQMIRVQWCNSSVEKLVREIQEDQQQLSNEGLKVLINLPDGDFRSS